MWPHFGQVEIYRDLKRTESVACVFCSLHFQACFLLGSQEKCLWLQDPTYNHEDESHRGSAAGDLNDPGSGMASLSSCTSPKCLLWASCYRGKRTPFRLSGCSWVFILCRQTEPHLVDGLKCSTPKAEAAAPSHPAPQFLFYPVAQVDNLDAILNPSSPLLPGAVTPVPLVLLKVLWVQLSAPQPCPAEAQPLAPLGSKLCSLWLWGGPRLIVVSEASVAGDR